MGAFWPAGGHSRPCHCRTAGEAWSVLLSAVTVYCGKVNVLSVTLCFVVVCEIFILWFCSPPKTLFK